jgi:hypothetical protein
MLLSNCNAAGLMTEQEARPCNLPRASIQSSFKEISSPDAGQSKHPTAKHGGRSRSRGGGCAVEVQLHDGAFVVRERLGNGGASTSAWARGAAGVIELDVVGARDDVKVLASDCVGESALTPPQSTRVPLESRPVYTPPQAQYCHETVEPEKLLAAAGTEEIPPSSASKAT